MKKNYLKLIQKKKHRIIEQKKQNGKSLFYIQQYNSFLKIWNNTYILKSDFYGYKQKELEFETSEHAKRILQEKINEYYENIKKIEGEKIVEINIISTTKIEKT